MNPDFAAQATRLLYLVTVFFALCEPIYAAANATDFMQGSPPPENMRVTKSNWYLGPYNRWALQHIREITPTQAISRGNGPVTVLPYNLLPVLEISLETLDGKKGTIGDWLKASYTDGFVALHKGEIVAEVYMNSMTAKSHHMFHSMSKSFVGNLAGILVATDQLDPNALITRYVPEMKGGAYDQATVRQLLDMTIGIDYSEDYDDPDSDVFTYSASSNANPNPTGLTLYGVLPTLKRGGEHGSRFHYVTANTDALGWVLQRASNRDLGELLATEIWSKLGAERDAYVISDLDGTPWMGAGFNATLRDTARFGLMMQQEGMINGQQIVPAPFVQDILENSVETGYGIAYRNQWWVSKQDHTFFAIGVAGQRILIAPRGEVVIVKFSSWPTLNSYDPDGRTYDARAFKAIIDGLRLGL